MARQQREENWKLRQELKQRRDNGEQDLVIRQGKIVTRWKRNLPTNTNGTRDKKVPRETNLETNLQENTDIPDPAPHKPRYNSDDNDIEIEVDGVFGSILTEIRQLGEREIASRQLGEIVMRNLKRVDQVAYVRFASVYRDFQDIKEFAEEISSLSKEKSKSTKKKK